MRKGVSFNMGREKEEWREALQFIPVGGEKKNFHGTFSSSGHPQTCLESVSSFYLPSKIAIDYFQSNKRKEKDRCHFREEALWVFSLELWKQFVNYRWRRKCLENTFQKTLDFLKSFSYHSGMSTLECHREEGEWERRGKQVLSLPILRLRRWPWVNDRATWVLPFKLLAWRRTERRAKGKWTEPETFNLGKWNLVFEWIFISLMRLYRKLGSSL